MVYIYIWGMYKDEIYIYTYIHMYIHIIIHIQRHIYIHIYICKSMQIYIYAHIHIYTDTYILVPVCGLYERVGLGSLLGLGWWRT